MIRDPVGDMVSEAIAAEAEAQGREPAPLEPNLPEPVKTSLHQDARIAKSQIESWMADPKSPYWKDTEGKPSSAWIREQYKGLLRAEQQGAEDAVGPEDKGVDPDLPHNGPGGYRLSDAAGARTMTAADREMFDAFAPHAFKAGLGNSKVVQATGWILTGQAKTVEEFRDTAVAAGWSDKNISECLSWHRAQTALRNARKE